MKIGMVLYGVDFPPDIRVEKETGSLIAAGHEVALICSGVARPGDAPAEGGFAVSRFGAPPRGLARLTNSLGFYTTFRFPHWRVALRDWASSERVEVLHVHDLPMAPTALAVAESLELPVVVDFHENYPAIMREWRRPSGTRRLFRIHRRYRAVELDVAARAERIITVVPEANERLVAAGIDEQRLVVVSNTEPLSYGDEVARLERDPRFGEDIVLVYAGGFGPHRGLEALIGAMPALLATGVAYRLVLAGDGETARELRDLAASLGVAERVEFPGWVDAGEVRSLIASADVCLVPHVKSEHTDTTVPHKLFQYMVSSRAVAVTDCVPLRRIVEEAECGIIVDKPTPQGWAKALETVCDRSKAAALGAAGRAACEAKYNWEADGARLVAMYDRIGTS